MGVVEDRKLFLFRLGHSLVFGLMLFFDGVLLLVVDRSVSGIDVPIVLRVIIAVVVTGWALRWLWRGEMRRLRESPFRFFPPSGSLLQRAEARWATLYELLRYRQWRKGRLLLGRMFAEQRPFGLFRALRVGSDFESHILTIGPAGFGKGRSALIPNLLTYPGSALVVDLKGELARVTAGRRGRGPATLAGSRVRQFMGQAVHIVDPGNWTVFRNDDGTLRGATARYNPLAEVSGGGEGFIGSVVNTIVSLLIPDRPDSKDPFWDNAARDWVKAVTLYVLCEEAPERHTLPYVRQLVKGGDREFFEAKQQAGEPLATPYDALLEQMKACPDFGGEIALEAETMAQRLATGHTGQSIIQVASTALEWIGNSDIAHVLSGSDFTFADLRRRPTTVYIAMPAYKLSQSDRCLITMMLQLANVVMEREKRIVPKHRILFFVDEFANIGHMKAIETAFPLMRGFDISVWAFIQDIDQLRREYMGAEDVISSNCDVIQILGAGSHNMADWTARLFGSGLVTAEQILNFSREDATQIILFRDERTHPAILEQAKYDKIFRSHEYDSDPQNPR